MFGTPQYSGLSLGMLMPSRPTTLSTLARGEMWPFLQLAEPEPQIVSLFEPNTRG
jgi:hypothetical protein